MGSCVWTLSRQLVVLSREMMKPSWVGLRGRSCGACFWALKLGCLCFVVSVVMWPVTHRGQGSCSSCCHALSASVLWDLDSKNLPLLSIRYFVTVMKKVAKTCKVISFQLCRTYTAWKPHTKGHRSSTYTCNRLPFLMYEIWSISKQTECWAMNNPHANFGGKY